MDYNSGMEFAAELLIYDKVDRVCFPEDDISIKPGNIETTKHLNPTRIAFSHNRNDNEGTVILVNPFKRIYIKKIDSEGNGIDIDRTTVFITLKEGEALHITNRLYEPTKGILVTLNADNSGDGVKEESAPVKPTPIVDVA